MLSLADSLHTATMSNALLVYAWAVTCLSLFATGCLLIRSGNLARRNRR